MRKHKAKKVIHHSSHSVMRKAHPFTGVDNTQDIELILEKNKLMQDVLGFSRETMGALFERALLLFKANRYDEAIQAFSFLTGLNPYVSDFWIGLGMSYQAHEHYPEALSSFFTAQTMDQARVESYFFALECCLLMKNFIQAEGMLKQALKYAKRHPRSEESRIIMKEARFFKDRIESERAQSQI